MAEVQHIDRIVQLGVESTKGTAVPATQKLSATMVDFGPRVEIARYRPSGFKFPTVNALNREWTEGTISGPITYTEIVYWLNSLVDTVTATGAGSEKTWTFVPTSSGSDDPTTFTVEVGSAERAQEFAYGLVTGMTMRFNRSEAAFDGTIMGKALTDDITLTAALPTIDLEPVTVPQVDIKLADTQAGLAGASFLSRDFSVEWSLTDRWAPVWVLNAATDWVAHVEIEPALEVRLLVAADAEGMDLLTHMRANDFQFMRIQCTGPVIDAADPYSIRIDTALKVEDVNDFQDQEGVTALEWVFRGYHDATWGMATEITVVNDIASL